MAVYTEDNHISRNAGADLSGKQFYIVKLNSDKEAVLASAAADKIIGVLANKPVENETADVAVRSGNGSFKVVAGGNVAIGDYLTSDANGKAVATTTAGQEIMGMATEAGVDGQVVEYIKANFRY